MKRALILLVALLLASCAGEPPLAPARPRTALPSRPPAKPSRPSTQAAKPVVRRDVGSAGALTASNMESYMDAEEMDFRRRLRGRASVARVGDDIIVTFRNDLLFENNLISGNGNEVLAEVGELLRHYDNTLVQVGGYTDTAGSAEQNLAVSQKRARLVADVLIATGVPAGRVAAQGFGEARLKKPTGDNVSEPRNRRIEIRIVPHTA